MKKVTIPKVEPAPKILNQALVSLIKDPETYHLEELEKEYDHEPKEAELNYVDSKKKKIESVVNPEFQKAQDIADLFRHHMEKARNKKFKKFEVIGTKTQTRPER